MKKTYVSGLTGKTVPIYKGTNPCTCRGIYGLDFFGSSFAGWAVYCTDCGRPDDYSYVKTKKEAVEVWNKMTPYVSPTQRFHYYIGRWQSPHKGHRWLISRWLDKNEPVCICIRPMATDEKNPFTPEEVKEMLAVGFKSEIEKGLVVLHILPVDVGDINTGRGLGYEIISHTDAAPEHIKRISATEIRRQIKAGEDGWRSIVMDGVAPYLEAKFND